VLTLHATILARRTAALLLLGGLLGCNNTSKSAEETPAARFCATLSEYATACPALATPCDQAMIDDCSGVVGLVSDGFLQTASDCIEGGGSPLGCIGGALLGLTPSPAHEAFVGQFCDECAFGVPGCTDVLLGKSEGSPELAAASALVLPLGDGLVDALREQCATGLGCLATFPTCAQQVLAEQAIPAETLQCVLDGFQGKLPEGVPAPAEGLEACGLGGGSETGTASGASGQVPTTSGATDAGSSGDDPPTSTTATSTTSTSATSSPDDTTTGGPVDPSVADTGDDDTTDATTDPDTGDDTGEWEQVCGEAYAQHDECGQGVALPAECTVCTYLICTYVDGYCCTTAWDEQCETAANERCAAACGAPGVCEHSPCEAGTKLDQTCSDCVLLVCDQRPWCCTEAWDSECAIMAADCGSC
jgi:hypothetical protein